MFPLFRFTLSNPIEGDLVISEPGGWDDAKLKLERNKEFHSLVEFYDQPLTFYGDDISHDGGIGYIRGIEQSQGIDAQISLLIETSYDEGDSYEAVFNGILSIETAKEIDFYKLEMGVLRNDFWQKFINRKDTPIDLSASVDLDGNVVSGVSGFTLNLPSQVITQSFERDSGYAIDTFSESVLTGTTFYVLFDNAKSLVDTIKTRQEYGSQISPLLPTDVLKYIWQMEFEGSYRFQAGLRSLFVLSGSRNVTVKWYYAYRTGGTLTTTQIGSTQTETGTVLFIDDGVRTLDVTLNLNKGDEFYIYGEVTLNSGTNVRYFPDYDSDLGSPFVPIYTSFEVTGNTVFEATITDAFTIKDAAESILSKAIGQNNIITSDYLDSCYGNYAIMKGLHVRGYSLFEKPFTLSFNDWWKGIDPILNLGLGYEQTSPETIRIESKSYFYDKTVSINFDFVNNIERSYDLETVFKLIEIGYSKWSAESESGIDDPQTKHIYNTRFKTVGKEIKILSQFIAASLAIEQTRRNRVELAKDWRLDEDVIIIATNGTNPELDENFASISNLLNSETRYNIRLSVARNFERWKSYFNGCLQWYLSDDYKFASGEGNTDMATTLVSGDCDAEDVSPEPSLSEKQDIEVTGDYLFKPIKYSFEHPLTWDEYKIIRDNPTKAIGVSRTDSAHVICFIDVLTYQITHGKGTFEVYLADNDYL